MAVISGVRFSCFLPGGLYVDNDIEIDVDHAFICESRAGAFVMGWLGIAKREDQGPPINAHPDTSVHAGDGTKPP